MHKFACLICLTVFQFALSVLATTASQSGKAASPVQASLRCDGNGLKFIIPDVVIFRMAFNDTSTSGYATVESTILGNATGQAECIDKRPILDDPRTSSVISVSYDQCGIVAQEDVDAEIIVYSAEAHISLLQVPITGAAVRKRFVMALNCQGPLRRRTFLDAKIYQHTTALESITVPFEITFSLTAEQVVRKTFGSSIDVNVHVIKIELDNDFRSTYRILGNRCWATGNISSSSLPSYEFVASQGCISVGEDYAIQIREAQHMHVVEIAGFEFSETTVGLYFHCDVNVCRKDDANQSRCEESCPSLPIAGRSGGQARSRQNSKKTNADFRLSSGRTLPRRDVPPQFMVNQDGTVHRKPQSGSHAVIRPGCYGYNWVAAGILIVAASWL